LLRYQWGFAMKHHCILAGIVVLASLSGGCESRDCEHIQNDKGDEICREDAEHIGELKREDPEESPWQNDREHPEPRD